MSSLDFSYDNFYDFCKANNLSKKEGFEIVLNRIKELSDKIKKFEGRQ